MNGFNFCFNPVFDFIFISLFNGRSFNYPVNVSLDQSVLVLFFSFYCLDNEYVKKGGREQITLQQHIHKQLSNNETEKNEYIK